MRRQYLALSLALLLSACESEEKLNAMTELSGPYCKTVTLGNIGLCICYEFTSKTDYTYIYGSRERDEIEFKKRRSIPALCK